MAIDRIELIGKLSFVRNTASGYAHFFQDSKGANEKFINLGIADAANQLERAAIKLNLEIGKSVDNYHYRKAFCNQVERVEPEPQIDQSTIHPGYN